jgi:ribosomal protein L7/L12
MRRFIFLAIAVYFLYIGSGIFTNKSPNWLDIGIGILFLVLSNAARTRRSPTGDPDQTVEVEPDDKQMSEVRALVSEGKEIEAIKRFQEETGVGIAEAKVFIESLERDRDAEPSPLGPDPQSPALAADSFRLPLSRDLEEAIVTIASSDQNEAIQKVIELTGVSMSEARTYVESLGPS